MRCAPSTRRFTDEPVSREVLERVFDNARFAPSGGNRQGWRVIVVTDADKRRRMRELYEQPWDEYMIGNGGRAALDAGEASGLPAGRLRMLQAADDFAHTLRRGPGAPGRVRPARRAGGHRRRARPPEHRRRRLDLPVRAQRAARPAPRGARRVVHHAAGPGRGRGARSCWASPTGSRWPATSRSVTVRTTGRRKLTRNPVSEFVFAERFGEPWSCASDSTRWR